MPVSKAPNPNYDQNVVFAFAQEFAKNMQATTNTIQELLGELKDHSVAMAQLKEQFNAMKENVTAINQLLNYEGSEGSVLTRLTVLRNRVESLEKWKESADELVGILEKWKESDGKAIKELEKWKDSEIETKKSEQKEATKGRTSIKVAVISGLLALIIAILNILFKK